jgi:hypothetical protein
LQIVRKILRSVAVGVVCGVVMLGTGWAVVGVKTPTPPIDKADSSGSSASSSDVAGALAGVLSGPVEPGVKLPAGWFLAGGAKVSIDPDPAKWLKNDGGVCGEDTGTYLQAQTRESADGKECLATFDHRWATRVAIDDHLYARSIAIGNGEKTVVFTTIDAVGWFAAYPADVCGDCGADAIAATIAEQTKNTANPVAADGLLLASSHTHAAPDTLSQTPDWYYAQVRDAIVKASVDAAAQMVPVILETGAAPAKAYNVDRRIVTRAVPDYELGWLRAYRPAAANEAERTVATMVNFAVHPTIKVDNAELHSGFVGPLTRMLEAELGGTSLWYPGGLGDQTVDRGFGVDGIGEGLAKVVLDDLGRGYRIIDNTIAVVRKAITIPGENTFMLAGSGAGLFIRPVTPPYGGPGGPATASKRGARRPTCATVAELTVSSSITGVRIGREGNMHPSEGRGDPGDSLTIISAPGEIFSSIAVTTKDMLSKTRNVMIFGMTNDTLGYLIPYEQYDESAGQGLGLANNATDLGNYEEALSLGRCAGDTVQNAMVEVGEALKVMGSGEGP